MDTVKFGSLYVPIIYTEEMTGTVPGEPAQINIPLTLEERFEKGVTSGSAVADSQGNPSVSCVLHGGTTDIHDGGLLIVQEPQIPTGNINYSAHWSLQRDDISYRSNDLTVAASWSGPVSNRTITTNLYAIKYVYPNATTESEKVGSYQICGVTQTKQNGNISYGTTPDLANIPLAKINHDNDTDYWIDEAPNPEVPPFDPSKPDHYDPVIDDTSDTVAIPSSPTIGISNAGLHHVYNPSIGGLQNFGEWLFPNPELPSSADPTEIVNYLLLLCQTLANTRLIDYVLDCHVVPVQPLVGSSQDIKVGGRTATGIAAPIVTSDYVDVSCGSLNLPEYFGGFQDYITHAKLYLPFCGFVEVIPEFWQAGVIAVDYKFNVIDGSFMAYIRSKSSKSQLNGSVIAQYSGSACVHLPITGINYANMISGLVSAASGVEGAKTATGVLGGAYSAANTVLNGGDMKQSNSYTSSSNLMGVRYPFFDCKTVRL